MGVVDHLVHDPANSNWPVFTNFCKNIPHPQILTDHCPTPFHHTCSFLISRGASVVAWPLDILIGQSSLSPVKSTVKSWIVVLNQGQNLGFIKVSTFWEGHKIWKNLPLSIWRYSVASNFLKVEDFFKFCAFLRRSKL